MFDRVLKVLCFFPLSIGPTRYSFQNHCSVASFTWYGAAIEMDNNIETDYTADEVNHCSVALLHVFFR